MPVPFKRFLYTTVRIEIKTADGHAATGTSFIFQDNTTPEKELFLVSNKHVVESGEIAYLFFTEKNSQGNPLVGQSFYIEIDGFSSQWHGHPNQNVDIAVMPLSWILDLISKDGKTAYIEPIKENDVATEQIFKNLDLSSPIVFVGFPNGMFDEKHFLPIFRRGHVATSPELDFNGKPQFLIDASVFPGSSGSPVFTVSDLLVGGTPGLKLLGIISAVYTQRTTGEIEWIPAPTNNIPVPSINQMIDLGVVFKVDLIRETIAEFLSTHKKP